MDCSVQIWQSALPLGTYGPVQDAGHKEDSCIALILSPVLEAGGWTRRLN